MPKNLVEKILDEHILSGEASPGQEVTIRIDQTLTQDATGTMAYLQLEAMQPQKLATELSVSYVDHNTTQIGFENADDHKYLQSIARKYGITFSRPGNGICHQVHLERFGKPGKTLLGSDSHTPTGGGIGMIAIGAGGLDVAKAMAKGEFTFAYPAVVKVELTGKLKPWVAAKDVILHLLQKLTTKGNVGTAIEYDGPGVSSLSVPDRATITNMGAELGVTFSVFPSDKNTRAFLKAQGREKDCTGLSADPKARYSKTIKLDLTKVVPMVARPHSPDNVVSVKEEKDVVVDQVAIGSCTNSSFRDLMIAARMLKGKRVHDDVSFIVATGSKQVLQMIADNGAFNDLLAAGARFAENACGFCIGNSLSPGDQGVSIRTSNRNFMGRSGTKSAKIFLTSVETAVASAIKGKLVDPRTTRVPFPNFGMPKQFHVDDGMIEKCKPNPKVKIYRGPNIGTPPENDPLPAKTEGVVAIKVGDKITTDHIMPAGDKLKYRSNVPRYSEFVFAPLDASFSRRAQKNREKGLTNVIVAGLSYGQGSSREHAALCPMYLGVKAVLAKSLERIHAANLINFGILPLTFQNPEDYDRMQAGDMLEFPGLREDLAGRKPLRVVGKAEGQPIPVTHSLSDKQVEIILAGGMLNLMRG